MMDNTYNKKSVQAFMLCIVLMTFAQCLFKCTNQHKLHYTPAGYNGQTHFQDLLDFEKKKIKVGF